MVSSVSGQLSSVDLLKSANAQARDRNAKNLEEKEPLAAVLEQLDPEKAETLKERLAEAKEISARLDAVKESADEQRKAAALQKIERIKAQIQALRLLASADPEAVARLAAKLGKELAAAVKDYAAAGGQSLPGVSAGPAPSGGAAPSSPQGDGSAGVADATAVQAPPDGASSAAASAVGASQAASPANALVSRAGGTEDGTAGRPNAEQTRRTNQTPGAGAAVATDGNESDSAIRDQAAAQVAKVQKTFGELRADQDFAADVRRLKSALKAIVETAKNALKNKQDSDPAAQEDIKDAEKALKDIDKALSGITTEGLAGLGAVSAGIDFTA